MPIHHDETSKQLDTTFFSIAKCSELACYSCLRKLLTRSSEASDDEEEKEDEGEGLQAFEHKSSNPLFGLIAQSALCRHVSQQEIKSLKGGRSTITIQRERKQKENKSPRQICRRITERKEKKSEKWASEESDYAPGNLSSSVCPLPSPLWLSLWSGMYLLCSPVICDDECEKRLIGAEAHHAQCS